MLFEPYWSTSHNEAYENDPKVATEALLGAFDGIFCQYREICRQWGVLHPSSATATPEINEWEETYQNLRFMTAKDFKEKLIGH